jgi:prevent-host-death family protein
MPTVADAAKTYEPDADQAVERAAAGERVVVRRHGTELVAVVPLEDLRRLQELEAVEAEEDRLDLEAVQQFDSDLAAGRESLTPLDDVLAELGSSRDDLSG